MNNFTPGPWRIVGPRGLSLFNDNESVHVLTVTSNQSRLGPKEYWTAQANVRLASAAPDMYAALTVILSKVEGIYPEDDSLKPHWLIQASMALAKAKGVSI